MTQTHITATTLVQSGGRESQPPLWFKVAAGCERKKAQTHTTFSRQGRPILTAATLVQKWRLTVPAATLDQDGGCDSQPPLSGRVKWRL